MWIYKQSTGVLLSTSVLPIGFVMGQGYSGFGNSKNNSNDEHIKDVGPIPQGYYNINTLILATDTHGPYVLILLPDPNNIMFGRSGFLIHGDSIEHPGNASKGCIILPRDVRVKIWTSDDHRLQVVA